MELDIERLKELKAEFEQNREYNDRRYMSTITEDDVLELIDEAIAKESATSEEVQRAIAWAKEELDDAVRYQHNSKSNCLDTILTALQQTKGETMIYQFEHEEIKRCRECPCHSWADIPDEKDWCDLQDKQLAYDTEPEYNDCPLVAISKTETVQPCEEQTYGQGHADAIEEMRNQSRIVMTTEELEECRIKPCDQCKEYELDFYYCPNCGRNLNA